MRFCRSALPALFMFSLALPLSAQSSKTLRLVAKIPLENVEGRIDHFGIDVKGERLFMSALGNNTVEVFDLRANRRLHTITGLQEPQGTTYAPDSNKIFVANARDGAVSIFDGMTYKFLHKVQFSSDADDTRYEAATHRVYVGYGEGAVAAMDSESGNVIGEIKLKGHPEAYEVEQGGGRMFINVPDLHQIAVADWSQKKIVATMRPGEYSANFPMAFDSGDHRLFSVARHPAQLLVFDSESGAMVAHIEVVGDSDDLWYDAKNHRIYITGGEGFITVVAQLDANRYKVTDKVLTAPGARTSFFSPEFGRLYVAVPHRGSQEAELQVYATSP